MGIGANQNRPTRVDLTEARPGPLDILTIAAGADDDDIDFRG